MKSLLVGIVLVVGALGCAPKPRQITGQIQVKDGDGKPVELRGFNVLLAATEVVSPYLATLDAQRNAQLDATMSKIDAGVEKLKAMKQRLDQIDDQLTRYGYSLVFAEKPYMMKADVLEGLQKKYGWNDAAMREIVNLSRIPAAVRTRSAKLKAEYDSILEKAPDGVSEQNKQLLNTSQFSPRESYFNFKYPAIAARGTIDTNGNFSFAVSPITNYTVIAFGAGSRAGETHDLYWRLDLGHGPNATNVQLNELNLTAHF